MDFKTRKEKTKDIVKNIGRFEATKVLVVGDIGLDEYLLGVVKRISPEAPVPVFEVTQEQYRAGLAANVAQNLVSLGGQATLLGVVGEDATAEKLSQLLLDNGVKGPLLVKDPQRPTTRKTRVMSGQHHIVRVDYEKRRFLGADLESEILQKFQSLIPDYEGLILQDYGKGVLSESLCQRLIEFAHKSGKKVVVDPHRTTPVEYYSGADLIKPNYEEAFILAGVNQDDLSDRVGSLEEVGSVILKKTGAHHVLITQGKEGAFLFSQRETTRVPTSSRQVFDVTGAGDTFISAFTLGWLSGFDLESSMIAANAAAGVVVGKVGSVPCTKEELLTALERPL